MNRFRTKSNEILNKNKLAVLAEIIITFLPLYLGLAISDKAGISQTQLGGQLVLLGGPLVYLGMIVSLSFLWIVSKYRGKSWEDYGLPRLNKWFLSILKGLGVSLAILGIVVLVINPIINAIPNLDPRDMSRFNFLKGDLPNLIINLAAMWITAGFVEEFLWRGYLMNRLMDLFSNKTALNWVFVLILSSIIFGLGHAYQDAAGMIKTGAVGLVFGVSYLVVGRNLWPLIFAHALIDSIDFITHFFGG